MNPYEAPSGEILQPALESDAETLRRKYIKHEAAVKSIGYLYLLGAACVVGMLMAGDSIFRETRPETAQMVSLILGGMAALVFAVGLGVIQLRRWVKVPIAILCTLSFFQPSIGTLINIYILYLVFSAKGKVVFSDDYKLVIQATPHVKYKSSILSLLILVLFIILLGLGSWFASRK